MLERLQAHIVKIERQESEALMPRVIHALNLLDTEGIGEATRQEIERRIAKLHPPKNPLRHIVGLSLSLDMLEEDGEISSRTQAVKKGLRTTSETLYRRLSPNQQASSA